MTTSVADDLSDRLRDEFPLLFDDAERQIVESPPPRIRALETARPPAGPTESADITGNGAKAPEAPIRPAARKERVSRRVAATDAYSDIDGFRGSAADPVHMYLKEIGKVKLLDASLEVELAERILAGNSAADRLSGLDGASVDSYPSRAADRVLVRRGQAAKEALIEA